MISSVSIESIVGNRKPIGTSNWAILSDIYHNRYSSLQFNLEEANWVIREELEGEEIFKLERNIFTMNRKTIQDKYGLLGVSLLDLSNRSIILTEGVSDFITTKLLHPNENVLGVTTLGGSHVAKSILVLCFDSFDFIADNDETGINNVFRWKSFLNRYNKQVFIYPPEGSFKDITDEFIFNIKLHFANG